MFDPIGMLRAWMAVLAANSLLAGVVFSVVLLVTRLVARRGPALHVALWSLVMIRLLLPPGLGHPFAVGALVERFVQTEAGPGSGAGLAGIDEAVVPEEKDSTKLSGSGGLVEPWAAAAALWVVGFVVVGAFQLRRIQGVQRVLAGARPADEHAVLAVCESWRHRLGVRRGVRVMTSASGMAPFTIGVLRPLIYLPQAVIDDSRCMEAAMAHEMAHVARLDALWLTLQNVLQTAYFFNPVVWITGARLSHAREMLCDATVVSGDRLAARDYAGGLLNVLRLELRRVGAPTMTARKRRIGVRIMNIIEREGGPRPMVGPAFVVTALFGLFLLPLGSADVGASSAGAAVADAQAAPGLRPGRHVEFVNPLPEGRVTWTWGPGHRDPFTHEEVTHRGIDVAAPAGTQVISPADGVVRLATEAYQPSPASGTVILIDHEDGLSTFFAHLGSLAVREGERVRQGAVIATVGSTGKSTGPHLHFEVRRDSEPVDPAEFVAEWRR